jgi:hypothetical protein
MYGLKGVSRLNAVRISILPTAPVRAAVGRFHAFPRASSPHVKQSLRVLRMPKQSGSGMSMNSCRGSLAIALVRRVLRLAAFWNDADSLTGAEAPTPKLCIASNERACDRAK